ncbi:uncharacterized protein LOC106646941 isoform X4 [Copidosoma floridanum]|uniref:uncharacterized protein LOC106646941 isoform X4 n=1 Tax=Copidosoma floridanum TaxID=29053 RepID=UPI0006C9CD09|nr:uncharacterized protein LOC106646941 isoform X4 [Copidosoma floridanum]
MIEIAKENQRNEYSPWSYDLLARGSTKKTILDDEDGQDLNNSMVNDLVAKVLDEDFTTKNVSAHHGNDNLQQYQVEAPIAPDFDIKLGASSFLNSTFHTSDTPTPSFNDTLGSRDQDYKIISQDLNLLNSNLCLGLQIHDKVTSSTNGFTKNLQRTLHTSDNGIQSLRQHPGQTTNDGFYSSVSNSYAPLTATSSSGENCNPQIDSWSKSLIRPDCSKDIIGHYSCQLQACNSTSTDYNLNVALNLVHLDQPVKDVVNLSELHRQQQLHYNLVSNSYDNSMLKVQDSYDMSAHDQAYCPSSFTVNNLGVDSGLLANSPLQHFSHAESVLQNCFCSNIQSIKCKEYQDYDMSYINIQDLAASSEQTHNKQKQLNLYKFNDIAESAYKRSVNHRPNLTEHQQQQFVTSSNVDSCSPMLLFTDQRPDAAVVKILNSFKTVHPSGGKSLENQEFSSIDYPRKLAVATTAVAVHEIEHQQQLKVYDQNTDCQRFIGNDVEALGDLQHNSQMERLRAANMNKQVHKSMEHWLETIKYVQECRKREIASTSKRQKENLHCISTHDDTEILALADSIYKLTKASRNARTAMYNAMQATLLHNDEFESKIMKKDEDILLTLKFLARSNLITEPTALRTVSSVTLVKCSSPTKILLAPTISTTDDGDANRT